MKKNWQILAASLKKEKLNWLLIASDANRQYLTGFSGSFGFVLIPQKGTPFLVIDSRYTLQAKRQARGFKISEFQNFYKDFWLPFVLKNQGARIGFEIAISHEKLTTFKKYSRGVALVPTKNLVEKIRTLKTVSEVKLIRKALKISDTSFSKLLKIIKPGMTETEVAWQLEKLMRELGAASTAWDPQIVAAGKNSALPHHGHSKTKIKKGDLLQLDFGCVYRGYHTDTSRVVFVGQPSLKQKELYDLVLRAQMLGISLVKSGVRAADIDRQVREFLENNTAGVYGHGLGHGVGLEVHENPNISITSSDTLQAGQVLTIEPGIYIEGWGGIRLEDMILVTQDGYQVLTKATKKVADCTL